jgi:CheY-like chemotaxis protein
MQTYPSTFDRGLYSFESCQADVNVSDVNMPKDGLPKILIVEDEAVLAMSLQAKLFALGYGIPAAVASGERAVQSAHDQQPDLVLMDIKLNGRIDGVEAARQIQELGDIPVIFMTADADIDTVQLELLLNPDWYLVKPVRLEDLGRVIEQALNLLDGPPRTH